MENLSSDTLLRKMDRIGDKLANMEMMNGENAPLDWQAKYDALEEQYRGLENEYESRKCNNHTTQTV